MMSLLYVRLDVIVTPHTHTRAGGYVIRAGVHIYIRIYKFVDE